MLMKKLTKSEVKPNLECKVIYDFHVWDYLHFLDYNSYHFIRTEDSYYLSIFVLQLINTFISLHISTFVILW